MKVTCDFCDNSANETEANLKRLGWLTFEVTHTLGVTKVRFFGAGCPKHRDELVSKFDVLMSKNSLKVR